MNIDLQRLYKVYKNLHIMMKARRYEPSEPELDKKTFINHVQVIMLENQDNPYEILDQLILYFISDEISIKGNTKLLMVYFHMLDAKFKKEDMEYINKKLITTIGPESSGRSPEGNELVIIVKENITPRVSNILQVMESSVQLFCMDELLINITEHNLVPKHELMTDNEKKALLNFYKCAENDFPTILDTDPMVKYYNWKIGSCIRIHRQGYYYRIVKSAAMILKK